jgi:chitinase
MSQRSSRVIISYCIISLLVCTSFARHAHRRPLHRHAVRAESTATEDFTILTVDPVEITIPSPVSSADITADTPESSLSAGGEVIEDILKINTGLNDLPEDLFNFILSLEQRLEALEKLFSGYNEGSDSPVGPVGPVLPPAPTSATQEASDITSVDATTSAPIRSATSSLCKPLGGVGPLRPCGGPDVSAFTTTHSTRITQTRTFITTVAPALPISTGIRSNDSFPAMNGTDFMPPAPWTKPYIASDAFTAQPSPGPSSALNSTATLTSIAASVVPTASPYLFDAESGDNVAVYYGTTPATKQGGLSSLCRNANVDIVILSFVFSFFDANGYPSIDFGPGCLGQRSAQTVTAPGLKDCSALAPEIAACQALDKKVLLSLGGYNSNTSFNSDTQATEFASTLWDLFGAGDGLDADLRPFGTDIILDGFDIDNENQNTDHYETLAIALREQFDTDDSKTYYLSAAPQCPIPDESIPLGALQQADFVWVQFDNNPSCNIDAPGFQQSFKAWSDLLASGTQVRGPRLYLGAAGFEGAGSGYVKGSGLGTRVRTARGLYVENFGGVMLWDGSEAALDVDQYGVDYLSYAKSALH